MKRLAAILLCSAAGSLPAHAADGLDEVMRLLASRQHGRADFVEQQFVAVLKRPAESSGELVYDAPGRLEKRTLEPRAEDLLLVGDQLTVQRRGRSRVVDLQAHPELMPFVESVRATLAGDLAALQQVFHVNFAGDVARWTLTLTPLAPAPGTAQRFGPAQTVSAVQIDGAAENLLRVEIRQADGDRSLMTLRPHAAQ